MNAFSGHRNIISHQSRPSEKATVSDNYQPHNPLAINLIAINDTRGWENERGGEGEKDHRERLPNSQARFPKGAEMKTS